VSMAPLLVVEIFIVMIGEIEVPHGPAFPSDFRVVRGFRVDGKNHVTGMVADVGIGMCHDVIRSWWHASATAWVPLDCCATIALRAVRRVESTACPL
jgi:hypothetical protein